MIIRNKRPPTPSTHLHRPKKVFALQTLRACERQWVLIHILENRQIPHPHTRNKMMSAPLKFELLKICYHALKPEIAIPLTPSTQMSAWILDVNDPWAEHGGVRERDREREREREPIGNIVKKFSRRRCVCMLETLRKATTKV